jgi:hypothetical protein
LKFLGELWAGQACAGTNQQELTTCAKSGGQHQKKFKKKGRLTLSRRQPAADRRSLVADQPRVDTWTGLAWSFFFYSFLFFDASSFIGSLGNGPGLLGKWVHSTTIFSSFPLHLEVSNLPFLIVFGDFTFFEILFFLNLE